MPDTGTSVEIAPGVRLHGDLEDGLSERELRAADGAKLPALCIDCGEAVAGEPEVRVYRGFAPGAWWLRLLKAGTRTLVVRMFGRKARVGVFVCDRHASRRRARAVIGLVGILAALPLLLGLMAAGVSGGASGFIFFVWTLVAFGIRWSGTYLLDVRGVTKDGIAVFDMPDEKFVAAAARPAAELLKAG